MRDTWLFFPIACGIVLGYQSITALPFLVGALQDSRNYSLQQIGVISGIEIVSMALVVLLLAPAINRFKRHYTACLAALGLAGFQLLSAMVSDFVPFCLCRIAAGICGGFIVAILNATLSLAQNPERTSAYAVSLATATDIALFFGLSWAIAQYDATAAYILLAAMSLVLMPSLLLFPPRSKDTPPLTPALLKAGLLVLLAVPCYAAGQTAIWSYVERMAKALSFSAADIALLLGVGSVIGLSGSLLAAQVNTQRIGTMIPLSFGTICLIISGGATVLATTPAGFVLAYIAFVFFYLFKEPFILGLAARLDVQGRVIAAATSTALLGAGFGAALAGQSLDIAGDFRILGLLLAILVGAGLVLIVPITFRLGRLGQEQA